MSQHFSSDSADHVDSPSSVQASSLVSSPSHDVQHDEELSVGVPPPHATDLIIGATSPPTTIDLSAVGAPPRPLLRAADLSVGSPPPLAAYFRNLIDLPVQKKLIDLCTYASLLLATALSILSTEFPYESIIQRHNRSITVIVLSTALLLFTISKTALEHIKDNAGWFYYHPGRGAQRVFYAKVVGQIIGLLVVISSCGVAAVNYTISKYNEGKFEAYGISVCAITTSLMYSSVQNIMKQKNITMVERTTNRETRRRLRACLDIPPENGSEFYEPDPEYELEEIVLES